MSQLARRVLLDFPAPLTLAVVSDSRIDLSWNSVIGAVSYRVYRNAALVDSPSTTSHSATGLTGATQYQFQVACVDSLGHEGPKSPISSGTTQATPDTTVPTTPVISAGSATLTSVVVSLVTPSIDSGSGIASYTLHRALDAAFSVGLVTTSGLTSFPLTVSNLASGTQYFFRLRAVDNAGNVGAFSATVNITTQAAQTAGIWPNWPTMNAMCIQGTPLTDATEHSMIADKDLVIFQSFYPTASRLQARRAAILAIKALQTAPMVTRFFMYLQPRASLKTVSTPGNSEQEVNKALIEDATRGNLNWIVHRTGNQTNSGRVENEFSPSTQWMCNMAVLVAGNNSLGENYAVAYNDDWADRLSTGADEILSLLSGIFQDAVEQCPPPMYQNNGALEISDQDYNANGLADSKTDYSSGPNAGGRFWAEGNLEFKRAYEARNPGKFVVPNSATWDLRAFDGSGSPPLPITNWPYYRKWEIVLDEVSNFGLGLRFDGTTGYRYTGGGSASSFFRSYSIQEKCLKLDANIPAAIGKGAVLMQGNGLDRTPNQDDYEFIRTCSLVSLLVERAAPCFQLGGQHPFSLDELLVELGAPVATRSMGTLNETTLGFTLRAADLSVGAARFYWAEYTKGIVVWRGDNPAVASWPSAAGNAAVCTLPPPGTGKKWQMLNASNYVNPITGRATRNQSPTLNNGLDVTQISLKPMHGALIRRVNV